MLNDADLELAVKAAVAGRYQNTGQVCAAAKRFIIEEGIASAFTETGTANIIDRHIRKAVSPAITFLSNFVIMFFSSLVSFHNISFL